jgi:3-mercaptopyruvate sulfurtransferase SseA
MLRLVLPLAVILAMPGSEAPLQTQPAAPPAAEPVTKKTPPPPADPIAAMPRISVAEAKKALDAGKAVLVDVRAAEAYQAEHAKGAISLPAFEMYARYGELPKGKQIITYCT